MGCARPPAHAPRVVGKAPLETIRCWFNAVLMCLTQICWHLCFSGLVDVTFYVDMRSSEYVLSRYTPVHQPTVPCSLLIRTARRYVQRDCARCMLMLVLPCTHTFQRFNTVGGIESGFNGKKSVNNKSLPACGGSHVHVCPSVRVPASPRTHLGPGFGSGPNPPPNLLSYLPP